MAEDEALFQKGMPIRREVLGPEYVDASMARADEFMMSFQRATTAWAWGWAWGEGTLDRKTRSLMNLAMLTALNRAPEIKLHVKGALNNGVTVAEIKAALLHATAYCGIPAGLDAFRAAHEVLSARARWANRKPQPDDVRGGVRRSCPPSCFLSASLYSFGNCAEAGRTQDVSRAPAGDRYARLDGGSAQIVERR